MKKVKSIPLTEKYANDLATEAKKLAKTQKISYADALDTIKAVSELQKNKVNNLFTRSQTELVSCTSELLRSDRVKQMLGL